MFLIQFDACNRDVLGVGSIGFVLYYDSIVLHKHSGFLDRSYDSNYAEYMALINALIFAVSLNIKELYVQGDAKIVINQINNLCNIKCDRVKPLHKLVNKLKTNFDVFNIEHIYRRYNNYADSLANDGLILHNTIEV